jgi:hypothetical protein
MTGYTISRGATTRQILHTTRGAAEAKSSSCTSIDYRKHGKILADVLYTLYWWSETKKKKKIDNCYDSRRRGAAAAADIKRTRESTVVTQSGYQHLLLDPKGQVGMWELIWSCYGYWGIMQETSTFSSCKFPVIKRITNWSTQGIIIIIAQCYTY